MRTRLTLSLALAALLAAPALAEHFIYTGNITSGAQYDLYVLPLLPGDQVRATLVCDEESPGNRPLDPVLSAYAPGVDPSDTINATYYNDDGFGTDDFPNGVDCNAFDSSIFWFTVDVAGDWTFRADGFGSATGPYTLDIEVGPFVNAVPTLDTYGLVALAVALAGLSLVFLKRRRA